ncbi:Capsule polysaccharide biosynthesis protein [Rhizobium sp. CF080]|uniref:capsular polysaccharide export protein, LipB/KpsS family n=1 Tax=Rhizobium sp. (strain CF080) TaxID=1144310 RepID=UPI00027192F2|nr:capsule polysaccharide export protein [Rhizobium sp. CF080]EUB96519.1 Capsule polysaccharide biosynthesis protein [Rhizobium sp. CF080]
MTANLKPDLANRDVFALHFRRWKRATLQAYFSSSRLTYLPLYLEDEAFLRDWASTILDAPNPVFLCWSLNAPPAAIQFARKHAIPFYYMEDGFIRSLVPNASQSPPFSLTLDSRTAHFDSQAASDLECLLNSYDFVGDSKLLVRAAKGIEALLASRLSKYNGPDTSKAMLLTKRAEYRRILVIGQVEDDASIKFGCSTPFTNNDLVRLAARENPGCEIVYKPHPDVLNGVRKHISNPNDIRHLCEIISYPTSLPELLDTADHVYTITSLGGFEALLRGIPVTVMGCPFYAGWGVTDDRQENPRRNRKLSVEQLFAGSYLLYPRYFNPATAAEISFEECLNLAISWRECGEPQWARSLNLSPQKTRCQFAGPRGSLGWRHLLTRPLSWIIMIVGDAKSAEDFRADPIAFFRELSNPVYRKIGRWLYPLD